MSLFAAFSGSERELEEEFIPALDRATHDWTMKAARGECGWICPSCCCGFHDGMPDECPHGDKKCTEYNIRDKAERRAFKHLWESTGGDWHGNPWVWVVEFEVVHQNVDEVMA